MMKKFIIYLILLISNAGLAEVNKPSIIQELEKQYPNLTVANVVDNDILTNNWDYYAPEDEFTGKVYNGAYIVSTDNNATMAVIFDGNDKKFANPVVAFDFSDKFDDNWDFHLPLCFQVCNMDLIVDDEKYPNIQMIGTPTKRLISQYSKTTLNRIKNGSVIKIRITLLSGDKKVYTFIANEPLNFTRLQENQP